MPPKLSVDWGFAVIRAVLARPIYLDWFAGVGVGVSRTASTGVPRNPGWMLLEGPE